LTLVDVEELADTETNKGLMFAGFVAVASAAAVAAVLAATINKIATNVFA